MSFESFGKESARSSFREQLPPSLTVKELLAMSRQEREALTRNSAERLRGILRQRGGIEYCDLSAMYRALGGETLLVRREDPLLLMDAVDGNEAVPISFPSGERYSNAVEWTPSLQTRGLLNAYQEGYGQYNGVVAVVGIRNNGQLDVKSLPDAEQVFAGLDRTYVRSISGSYHADDVAFVSVRIPVESFPEEQMTDQEKDAFEEYRE